jgi:hypothetical protein
VCLNNRSRSRRPKEFKAALLAARDWNRISPLHLPMLQLQCRAPDCALSASQMARELKLKNVAVARLRERFTGRPRSYPEHSCRRGLT